jgi:hypothetical protein
MVTLQVSQDCQAGSAVSTQPATAASVTDLLIADGKPVVIRLEPRTYHLVVRITRADGTHAIVTLT